MKCGLSFIMCVKHVKRIKKFTNENRMSPEYNNLPDNIRKNIENITIIEEMLISPILAVMSICRLPGDQLISILFN